MGVQKLRSYDMVQLPTQSSSRAVWSVSSCRLNVFVASVRMCCSCRPNREISARWAPSRNVPNWANAVRTGSGDDRASISVEGVSLETC